MLQTATITRCEPNDPNRCQSMTGKGQCGNLATAGKKGCPLHGGNAGLKESQLRNYRLTKFHAQVQRLGDSSEIKSIRDEIGILRMILEERLNACTSEVDLMMESHTIADLVMKIEHLVVSCTKLESSLGQTLDKQTLMTFATQVVGIIAANIEEPDILDIISNGILDLIKET